MTNIRLLRGVIGFPGGHHRDKYIPIPKETAYHQHNITDKRQHCAPFLTGNLHWTNYRYWIGREHSSIGWAKCRVCGQIFANYSTLKEQILDHEKHTKCVAIAGMAYKNLRDIKSCAVCGREVWIDTWGIPMHDICRDFWRFGNEVSPMVQRAYAAARIFLYAPKVTL